jgi:peptidoglycan/xylan/chitin deacetylase (PgdA/CDA1 family)
MMYFLMTNDVESFSIPLNREDSDVAKQIYEVGLPRLLDLFSKHDIQSTFYFTGMFAEQSPESVELVKEHDHEIGCHGYDHSPQRAFDVLSYEVQVDELKKAKRVIEDAAGRIESFRAPMLRINEDTVRALEETGFKSDSSVASQRFDGLLTFGSKKKLKWLVAPRKPYTISYDSIVKSGSSNILEIPISATIVPFIGTTMRISPFILKILQKYLYHESKKTEKPIVFLFHPNECLDIGDKKPFFLWGFAPRPRKPRKGLKESFTKEIVATRRTNNPFEYLFADVIRHKLKNMGLASLMLLDDVLMSAKEYGFEFVSVNECRKLFSYL